MLSDFAYLLGRIVAAIALLPLTLAFTLAYIHVIARVFGIGRPDHDAKGLRAAFNLLEKDARALAIFLGATVIAAALLAGKLVG